MDKEIDYKNLKEHEPNLGPGWALLMLILYFLKSLFPAERYSFYWYFQVYVLLIVTIITVSVFLKRMFYFKKKDIKK
jgi:Fe2+ transport system protein B